MQMADFVGAWAEAITQSAVRKVVNTAASKLTSSAANALFGSTAYQPSRLNYRQVHLPKSMRRYARRFRRRYGRGRRRRFGRKRYARRSTRTSTIATSQRDVSRRYRSGRRGYGTRSFAMRVQSALVQLQPLSFYTYQTANTITGTANQDSLSSILVGGTTVPFQDELFQMFKSAYAAVNAVADAKTYELYIRSLVTDVQLTNASAFPIMVDVYKLLCRRPFISAVTVDSQLSSAWAELGVDSHGSGVTVTKPTLTPFDAPNFCQYWKVLSKQSTILLAGNFITMQTRLKRVKGIDGKVLTSSPQALHGYSQAYLFIVRGSPQDAAGVGQLGAPKYVLTSQTNLHFSAPPGTQSEYGRTA